MRFLEWLQLTGKIFHGEKSPKKTKYESQIPLSSWNEQQPTTERLVMGACSSNYSEWNVDKTWYNQPVCSHSTRTDSLLLTIRWILTPKHNQNWSLESRSFLHRVNDQVRKRQNQSSTDATEDSEGHSVCIHGEELLRQLAFNQKYRRSHKETDVRHIWEIGNRTIRRDLWN